MKLSFSCIGGSTGKKLIYLDNAVLELENNKELDIFVKEAHGMIETAFNLQNVEFQSIDYTNESVILNCSSEYYTEDNYVRSFAVTLEFNNIAKLEKFLKQVKTEIKQQKIQKDILCN